MDKAAQAWKDSFRKVEKFKNGNNDNIFKKFDEDTKVILRDILKNSQNYNDLDMLDHTILFVVNLGLSKNDEVVREAIAAKQKVGFSQMKKAIKRCQSALEKNKDDAGFFNSLAYLEDRDNLVISWDSRTRLNNDETKKFIGVPYLWGGTSSKGFDCSGFTKTVYLMNGIIIPRDASQQVNEGLLVDADRNWDKLQEGDLMFFGYYKNGKRRIDHVAIWIGNGKFIQASKNVRINSNLLHVSHLFLFLTPMSLVHLQLVLLLPILHSFLFPQQLHHRYFPKQILS